MSLTTPELRVAADLMRKPRYRFLPRDWQKAIKWFFGANASLTIAVLVLIMIFLVKEGARFFPTYQKELQIYRHAGLEYCDFIKKPLAEHARLASDLRRAVAAEVEVTAGEAARKRNEALRLVTQMEEGTKRQRYAVEDALEETQVDEGALGQARAALTQAAIEVAARLEVSPSFSAEEQKALRAALAAMQPDQDGQPAFIQELMTAAAALDAKAKEGCAGLVDLTDGFEEAIEPIEELEGELEEKVLAVKAQAVQLSMAVDKITQLRAAAASAATPEERERLESEAATTATDPVDYATTNAEITKRFDDFVKLVADYKAKVNALVEAAPRQFQSHEAERLVKRALDSIPLHFASIDRCEALMRDWNYEEPVPITRAISSFLFGGDWITNSTWQDLYGMVPLLVGSVMIALIALVLAVPFSLAAAIYVNQLAAPWEQELIKPGLEFVQAIPSVVFGFIGISVVGESLKEWSEVPWLSWMPGFPIQERLNMFTAGCLLALMAMPTMFSLAEDAINNVPHAYSEASESLGATKIQTLFRVIIPSALSGIFAAVLLGFGRIIGETMVVLLVAGNRIAIPDFSDGIGTVFQPAHTLTGIIAQELGEVARGTSHWEALFMVGIVLFVLSLGINYGARRVVRKYSVAKA